MQQTRNSKIVRVFFSSLATSFLCIQLGTANADVVLSVDINDRTDNPADTQAGFDVLRIDSGGGSSFTDTFGDITVAVQAAGFALGDNDRRRTTPTNGGALTQGALYRDFAFATQDNTISALQRGYDVTITGLKPGQEYEATVWSFDTSSPGTRTSDWSVIGQGSVKQAINNYTFNGSSPPTADADNRFSFAAIADDSGQIVIRGRQDAANSAPQVFFNAVQLDEQNTTATQLSEVVSVDFDARSGGDTQAGFQSYTLAGPATQSFGDIDITVTGNNSGLDDRSRSQPTNGGSFTQQGLLRDFIFASTSDEANEGLDILVEGLTAGKVYDIALWAFDDASGGARTSDWFANGDLVFDDYQFAGENDPLADTDYQFGFLATANALGEILIQGRGAGGSNPNVFLNGLQIQQQVAVPEPSGVMLWLLIGAGMSLYRFRSRNER